MDIVKSNKIAYIISIFIGSLVYWSIVSNVIHTAYAITLSAVGYVICLLFLITHFNEYVLNSNNSVMERYYSDRMSVCPKCGNIHVLRYHKVFYSRKFMLLLKLIYSKNAGNVHIVTLVKCDKCNHTWYGGFKNISKIDTQFNKSCI